jgi:hypothetical protein
MTTPTFAYTVVTTRNGGTYATARFADDLMAALDYLEVLVDTLHNKNGFAVKLVNDCSDPRLSYTSHPGHSGF